jgi:hypothetical protein
MTIEYAADGQVHRVTSELSLLPGLAHSYATSQSGVGLYDLVDSWRFSDLSNPRTYRLQTSPLYGQTLTDPVVTLNSFRLSVEVDYERPVAVGGTQTATTERTMLYEPWQPTEEDTPEECSFAEPNLGVSVCTQFYLRWVWGGSTPTNIQFVQTCIKGLTTEPILLTGYFSQSVGGGAHLCPKNFLFEPGLESGISPKILNELRAKNIRLIYFTTGARECRPTERQDTPPMIRFYGFDEPIECPPEEGASGQ